MVKKTYTREVIRLFTREELAELLKRAHEECKKEVPITYHRIGRTRKRAIIARDRSAYLACIKRKIDEAIKAKLSEIGAKAAI